MDDIIEYKNFLGTIEFSKEKNNFHGQVLNIKVELTYEGNTIDELIMNFQNTVDDYLDLFA
jgi:predicted HicB family RNase H-like nuclease